RPQGCQEAGASPEAPITCKPGARGLPEILARQERLRALSPGAAAESRQRPPAPLVLVSIAPEREGRTIALRSGYAARARGPESGHPVRLGGHWPHPDTSRCGRTLARAPKGGT